MTPLKFIEKLAYCLVLTILFSCNSSIDKGLDLTFLPCLNDDDEYGFLDKEGRFVKMQSIEDELGGVINGYYFADGKLYLAGDDIQDTTSIILSGLESAGIMNDGLIPVCREFQNIEVVKQDGTLAFRLSEYCGEEVRCCFSYSDSKMRVLLDDGKYIYVDKEGQMLYEKKYSWATDFKNGYAVTQLEGQNYHLFSLIDETSTTIFTFESEDEEDITISYDYELLCGKENNKMIIYDFKGKRVLECPSKVDKIQNFMEDGFVFCNDDDEYGVMSYSGDIIIKAKYDQLFTNGLNYLVALDDEVDLIDNKDQVIKRLDGEKIVNFSTFGFNFPNIIVDDDENLTIIDESGDIIADDLELEFDIDEIIHCNIVRNSYIPKSRIIETITSLINNGKGLSNMYGCFFSNDGHCHTYDVSFLKQLSTNSLSEKKAAYKRIDNGVNYLMYYNVEFDEPIVRDGETSLNTSAWLTRVEIEVDSNDPYSCVALRNTVINKIKELGCSMVYSKDAKFVFESINKDYLYAFVMSVSPWVTANSGFKLLILPNNSNSMSFIQSYKSK